MWRRVRSNGAIKMLTGLYPHGPDPVWPGLFGRPLPRFNAVSMGIVTKGQVNQPGRMTTAPTGATACHGTLVVADNDFSTGRVELVLGNYRLINSIDYQVGLAAANTATNLAAAISLYQGFAATALGITVTIVAAATADEIDFRALHYGTKVNFTPLTPDAGILALGSPQISAPVLL